MSPWATQRLSSDRSCAFLMAPMSHWEWSVPMGLCLTCARTASSARELIPQNGEEWELVLPMPAPSPWWDHAKVCSVHPVDCWIGPQMPHGSNVLINVPTVGFTPFPTLPLLPGVIPIGKHAHFPKCSPVWLPLENLPLTSSSEELNLFYQCSLLFLCMSLYLSLVSCHFVSCQGSQTYFLGIISLFQHMVCAKWEGGRKVRQGGWETHGIKTNEYWMWPALGQAIQGALHRSSCLILTKNPLW